MNDIRINEKLISSLNVVLFMSAAEMMEASSIRSTTWYAIQKKPADITIQNLLAIANGLHIPVRRFFSTDKADLIGKQYDYVVEQYTPCHYDADALQEIVNNRTDTTWQKAADATGMTRDNLRKSLLAIRRTPVTRFLKACAVLGIDPFTILIDPNPEAKKRDNLSPKKEESIRTDIANLSQKLNGLNTTIKDLSEKYESLLRRHTALLERHNKLEQSFNEYFRPSASIAADSPDNR